MRGALLGVQRQHGALGEAVGAEEHRVLDDGAGQRRHRALPQREDPSSVAMRRKASVTPLYALAVPCVCSRTFTTSKGSPAYTQQKAPMTPENVSRGSSIVGNLSGVAQGAAQ